MDELPMLPAMPGEKTRQEARRLILTGDHLLVLLGDSVVKLDKKNLKLRWSGRMRNDQEK